MNNKMNRRNFTKTALVGTAALAVTPVSGFTFGSSPFDPKGLPTRTLGNTGVKVPLLGMGLGSRWISIEDEEEGLEMLEFALDHGLYYWDTASTYASDTASSEERVGKLLKNRRSEVFQVTKVQERNGEQAKKIIERSLRRLQTDYIDLLHVHAVKDIADVENLGKKGQVLEVLHDYRDQGIIRHIGFTGHSSAEVMKRAAELYDFEVMMIALNHTYHNGKESSDEHAVPFAAKKGMGIVAMKVIRPKETIEGLASQLLVRYALSLDHFSIANIAHANMDDLNENLETVRKFKRLKDVEMEKVRTALVPFYRHENLAWMDPGYTDGVIDHDSLRMST
jgi:predicted aldo/keto reductase-like oxidoreductase